MAIVIHWSSVRGFGILRSQVHGEVAFQGASLVNVKEMAVGDMVSFDLGFDQKKNRPEAININKVGAAPGEVVGTSTSSNQKSSEEKVKKRSSSEEEKAKEKESKEKGGRKAKSRSRRRRSSSSSSSSSESRKKRRKKSRSKRRRR